MVRFDVSNVGERLCGLWDPPPPYPHEKKGRGFQTFFYFRIIALHIARLGLHTIDTFLDYLGYNPGLPTFTCV